MVDEKILTTAMSSLLIIVGSVILRLTLKLNKSVDESLRSRLGSNSKSFDSIYKNKRFERLVREQEPFNWRIGLALAISELDNQQEKQFLASLSRVLRYENSIIHRKDDEDGLKRRILRQFLHPNFPSKDFKEILRFKDLFTVKRLMDGSTDIETLKYILRLSIDEYESKKIPPTSFIQNSRYMDSDDDPFSPEPPF